ncbi:MAG: hypothetical protein II992_05115 [Lachnospiraceae bacterium]|nr:hypothetical protein [Lachnospiraceae bacterium]
MFEQIKVDFYVEDKILELTANYDVIDRIQTNEKESFFSFIKKVIETDEVELFSRLVWHTILSAVDFYNQEHIEKITIIKENDLEKNIQNIEEFKEKFLRMIIDSLPCQETEEDFVEEEETEDEYIDIAYLLGEARRVFHYTVLEFRKETPRNFWRIYIPYLKMCGRYKKRETIDDIFPV